MDEATRYGGFTVRTECNHCGNPLPLHGPLLTAPCPHCLEEAQIPAEVWKTILEDFDEQHESLSEGQGAVSVMMVDASNIRHEHKKHVPSCEKCGAPFGVNQLPVGTDTNFACTQCGDPASTHPVPQWLRRLVPTARQFYSTEPGAGGASALSLESAQSIKPVAMACPACGGSLAATTESERIMACRFCHTDVYLPDDVWRRLHPVATVKEWFIRFEGQTRAQLAEEKQAARQAKRNRRSQEKQRLRSEKERQTQLDAQAARQQRQLAEEREITRMKAFAYVASLLFVLSLVSVCALAWLQYSGSLDLGSGDLEGTVSTITTVLVLLACGVLLIIALAFAARPIKRATGYDGDWMLFCIWFWLPFALGMPGVGQLMALVRALILFRGKFGSSTITTNNTSTSSYAAVRLTRGEARPAAIVFLALALLYPLTMASLFAPAKLDALLQGEITMEQLNSRAPLPQTGVRGLQPQKPK
ncbi:MAG: hypothetical protein GXP55_20660 [Deltaproteobacteria bacterium]|nr:hypothetical protein [Deltaproteobacteria bacterium]